MIIYGRMMLKNNMMINDLHEVIYLCSLLLNEWWWTVMKQWTMMHDICIIYTEYIHMFPAKQT